MARLAWLLLLFLLVSPLGSAVPKVVEESQQSALALGFSAASLSPVSDGVPVYERGDQLWAESFYNHTVLAAVLAPNQSSVVASRYLYPDSPSILYNFGTNDTLGEWDVQILESGQPAVPVQLVSGGDVEASVSGPILSGGAATYSASVGVGDAYGIQGCLIGENLNIVTVKLPNTVSTGILQVESTGDSLSVALNGSVVASFTYQFELYQDYSYELPGSAGLDTFEVEVGLTSPNVVSGTWNGSQTTALDWLATPRPGRFDLRTIITSVSGAQLLDSQILLANGSMVQLQECAALISVSSNTFQMTANLDISISRWPRQLLLMYDWGGVEDYEFTPIDSAVSRVEVTGGPWEAPLKGASISIGPGALPGVTSTSGSVLYYAGLPGSFPVAVNITVSLLGRSSGLRAVLEEPFSSQVVAVPAGQLVVSVTSGGAVVRNASVEVVSPAGSLSGNTISGSATFVLFPGSYQYTVSSQNQEKNGEATVVAGAKSQLVADLTPPPYDLTTLLLVAAAIAGVLANLLVWAFMPRRRGY